MTRLYSVDAFLLWATAILFAAFSHYFFWQIGDDSYIYFRYIDRALAGHWWSWSDHIPAVEGYSSPLWYLLLIGLGKMGLAVEMASRLLGLFTAFLTVLGCWRLTQLLTVNKTVAAIACLLLVCNHGFQYWSTSGLEAPLYMAMMIWSCVGIISGKAWLLPTALIGIARPEGPFLLVALFFAIIIFRRSLLNPLKTALLWLPLVAWLITRCVIYGAWLPNTFYAKATGDALPQLLKGILYGLPVLLPLLLMWGLWFRNKLDAQRNNTLVVLGMISMLMGLVVVGGGDWMFHFRLLLPVLALVFALAAYYWQQVQWGGKTLLLVAHGLLLVLSVPPQHVLEAFQGKQLPLVYYQEGNMTHQSIVLAKALEKTYPDALVAVNHAGALPWAMPQHNVIDMVGLNDGHIARVEGHLHQKYDADYVLSLKPDIVILNSRTKPGTDGSWYHPGYWSGETALYQHPDFTQLYEPTDIVYSWQWQIPFPYSLVMPKPAIESWILVYQRKK